MSALIDWQNLPQDVIEILRRGLNVDAVIPRALKSDDEKSLRSVAEVFTPARVVKFMVDALELEKLFWQERVDSKCLEVACGEAPFITTRYDAESGEFIPLNRRVGILDRKFQAIQADKNFWATRAVQSVYGYELQPDSLLIARANILLSFVEFVQDVSIAELREVAEVVTKNFWLMDGQNLPHAQGNLFDTHEIRITDWLTGHEKFFTGGNSMKFDFLISNPPYNEETANTSDKPVYHEFMEAAFKAADKALLITPARFLFDAGKTPKDFNRRMLDDPHLKVLSYEPNAGKLFRNAVNIEGGVAITLHDKTRDFGAIGIFTQWQELNSIHHKICVTDKNFRPFNVLIFPQSKWDLEALYAQHPDCKSKIGSDGTERRLTTSIFDLTEVFHECKPDDGHEYIKILGLSKSQRVYRFVRREFIADDETLSKYKVFVPKANGASGKLVDNEAARIISKPVIGELNQGCTQTFITVGAFDTLDEAENCFKYIKSKFARVMLGILKATQDNPPDKWAKVPLQDFTSDSDIDWSEDVDGQLYRKYGLSDEEISFIETHVKAMD